MSELLTERAGATLTLTLNRPDKMNALSASLVEALQAAVDEAARSGVRLLVLRGNGRNFSAGFDFGGVEAQSEGDLLLRFVRIELLLQAVWTAPLRTVACVHGRAWGAGADLVAACDVRLAQAATTFRFPGAAFGIVLGTRRLAERIGATQARAIVTSGREIGAPEALRLGLVTGIVEQSGADAVAALPEPRVVVDCVAPAMRRGRLDLRVAGLALISTISRSPVVISTMKSGCTNSVRAPFPAMMILPLSWMTTP